MTKEEFLKNLRTFPSSNVAVQKHIAKVEMMDDAAFNQHLAAREAQRNNPAVRHTVKRMVASTIESVKVHS